jgi:hypothetical protein
MVQKVWAKLPGSVRKRPFDIFVALFLASAGVYQIADPNFPELQQQILSDTLLTIISLYMIAAGLAICWCITVRCTKPLVNMYVEMYSWFFMWAAVTSLFLFQIYIGIAQPVYKPQLYYGILWFWLLLSITTFIRWFDLYLLLRRIDKS